MGKSKRLQEDLQESKSLAKPESLETTKQVTKKETGFLLTPDVFQRVINYLPNSIPKTHTVSEVAVLIELVRSSKQIEVTFNN